MQKQPGRQPGEKEFQNAASGLDMEVERAVDEFEVAHASREQAVHRGQKRLERKCAHGNVQRGQAEFAFKRAPARRFDVDQPVSNVLAGVFIVRRRELRDVRRRSRNELRGRRITREDLAAHLWKNHS